MDDTVYTAAVITVSDKGAAGEREDLSGPAVAETLRGAGFDVVYTSIVPDEREDIKRELIKCSDGLKLALVITTGGTGFSPRDVTPEATLEVIERAAPGIPEAMRQSSLKITDRAMLTRARAGIRRETLIINLPGSPRAARENIEAVLGALKHGLEMLREPPRDHA
jgi:molybdenum cofactor synthesis domain-containing protein